MFSLYVIFAATGAFLVLVGVLFRKFKSIPIAHLYNEGTFDEDELRQVSSRDTIVFGVILTIFSIVAFLSFWFYGQTLTGLAIYPLFGAYAIRAVYVGAVKYRVKEEPS